MDVQQYKEKLRDKARALDSALAELESATGANVEVAQQKFDRCKLEHETAKECLESVERTVSPSSVQLARGFSSVESQLDARTYRLGGPHSFIQDSVAAQRGSAEAIERLTRNAKELFDAGKISEKELRAIGETAGSGGELVAPLYMQEEYLKLARAGRPYWNVCNKRPLPPNANTINIPRLKTGTETAAQKDLAEVTNTNLTTGLLTFDVITVAGNQDFARQLFDRAVPELADMVVFPDLVAEYMTNVDVEALTGSGVAPHATGVLNTAEVNSKMKPHKITYTSGSPTLKLLYGYITQAIAEIHETRFLPPDVIVMHPRRWGWCLNQFDSNERPLIVPNASGPFNVAGILERVGSEGVVGSMLGLPVVVDPSIPTNKGSGTNQDVVIVQRSEDIWAMEDEPIKMKTYEEVLSKELAIRCQVFNYLAFTSERYPQSVSIIEGTGLATPTW